MAKNMPSGPGIYWAREKGFEWYNLMVYVYGVVPFMRMDVWYINDTGYAQEDVDTADIEEFGELIVVEPPKVEGPREDIHV